jgi:hypothetical protein
MRRTFVAVILGLFSPLAYMVGAEAFGSPGPSTPAEVFGGASACALYLGICQFLVARNARSEAPIAAGRQPGPIWQPEPGRMEVLFPEWPVLAAMLVPLAGAFLLVLAVEKASVVYWQGFPMLISGMLGALAGALIAHATWTRRPRPRLRSR